MVLFDGFSICSMFPDDTFSRTWTRNLFTPTKKFEKAYAKYVGRGFREEMDGLYLQDLWTDWPRDFERVLPERGWRQAVDILDL
jgi:hypothetical protein